MRLTYSGKVEAKGMNSELKDKVKKYRQLTESALRRVKIKVERDSKDFAIAADFLIMAQNYFNDAKYFEQKNKLLTALAAYSYAHAWLDAGVRANLLEAKGNNKLFTLP